MTKLNRIKLKIYLYTLHAGPRSIPAKHLLTLLNTNNIQKAKSFISNI